MTPDAATDVEPASGERLKRVRWRLTGWAFLIAVVVVLIDQGTKVWAEATLAEHERIPLVGNLLGLQLAYNPGASRSTWRRSPKSSSASPCEKPARAPRPGRPAPDSRRC